DGGCRGSAGLLLAGDRALGALAGARVGLRALAVDGQAAAVAQPLVAAALDLAADIGGDLTAQVTLDHVVRLEMIAELDDVLAAPLASAQTAGDPGRGEGLEGAGSTHAEDVRQGDFDALLARKVHSHQTCHVQILLLSRRPEPIPRPGLFPGRRSLRAAGGRLAPVGSSLLLWCPQGGRCPEGRCRPRAAVTAGPGRAECSAQPWRCW